MDNIAKIYALACAVIATREPLGSAAQQTAQEAINRAADAEAKRERQPLTAAEREGMRLRRLLFLHHGCTGPTLYGDDGEMQCYTCRIDFRNDSLTDIELHFMRQGLQRAAQSPHT